MRELHTPPQSEMTLCTEYPGHEPAEVLIDPNGDLRLVVGQDSCLVAGDSSNTSTTTTTTNAQDYKTATVFIVSSGPLAVASPVFRKMLFGPLSELSSSSPSPSSQCHRCRRPSSGQREKEDEAEEDDSNENNGGLRVVRLPEDDAGAVGLLLRVMHYQFGLIPRRPPPSLLFRLAVVADKYDCTGLLQPWVAGWIAETRYDDDGVRVDEAALRRWVSIAWVFGARARFEEAARDLALLLRRPGGGGGGEGDGGDDMTGPGKEDEKGKPMPHLLTDCADAAPEPEDLYAVIDACRLELMTELLRPFEEAIAAFSGGSPKPSGQLRPSREEALPLSCRAGSSKYVTSEYCQAAMLGCLVRGLSAAGLYPLPRPGDLAGSHSVAEVAEKLRSLDFSTLDGAKGHSGCRPVLHSVVDGVLTKHRSLTTESQARSLERRARESGLAGQILDPAAKRAFSINQCL